MNRLIKLLSSFFQAKEITAYDAANDLGYEIARLHNRLKRYEPQAKVRLFKHYQIMIARYIDFDQMVSPSDNEIPDIPNPETIYKLDKRQSN